MVKKGRFLYTGFFLPSKVIWYLKLFQAVSRYLPRNSNPDLVLFQVVNKDVIVWWWRMISPSKNWLPLMTGLFVFGFSVNCHHGIQDLFSELTGKYSFFLGESRTFTTSAVLSSKAGCRITSWSWYVASDTLILTSCLTRLDIVFFLLWI